MGIEYNDFPNVEEIYGEIYYNDFENDPVKAGRIELHYYNYGFIDEGFSFYHAFDRSINTIAVGNAILDYESSDLKNEVEELIGISCKSDILVIQEIMFYPDFRNKGYGKEVISGIETFFKGRCGYIVLQSFPKQHDASIIDNKGFEEFGFEKLNANYRQAQSSLDAFYKNCGYCLLKIENSEDSFFIKNINPL